jgi:hypothetical protein
MKDLGEIAELINNHSIDIRAEVIAANMLEWGLEAESLAVFHAGQFKRPYSPDVLSAEVVRLNDHRKVLAMRLSRDGLYDDLPEGMFHEFSTSPLESGKDMATESRSLKKQEEASRQFFRPIEQELFYHRVLLEKEERRLLNKISSRRYQDIFQDFWKITPDLPGELISEMILILPFAHRIAGDYALAAACLSALLNENVKYRQFEINRTFEIKQKRTSVSWNELGNCSLGGDLISGESFNEICPAVEFIIGPIVNSDIADYIGKGKRVGFIRCFFSYFVPIGMEYSFSVEKPVRFHFTLSDGEEAPVMGYNTVI